MPYFLIEKLPVFLSWTRYGVLYKEAVKEKDAVWRVSSMIAGSKAAQEKSALMYRVLLQKFCQDPAKFRSEWVRFDLSGEEAAANVWDLLYDYCHFRSYAFLSDLREAVDKVIASYEGEDYQYPMGRVFSLNHFVKPVKWWMRFRPEKRHRTISVLINSDEVIRLVGDLTAFEVHGYRFLLLCGEQFQVRLFNAKYAGRAEMIYGRAKQESGCEHCWPSSADAAWEARAALSSVHVLIDKSHFYVVILACTHCTQRFVFVWTETIDWQDGNDPQYSALLPITEAEAVELVQQRNSLTETKLNALGHGRRGLRHHRPKGEVPGSFWVTGLFVGPHD